MCASVYLKVIGEIISRQHVDSQRNFMCSVDLGGNRVLRNIVCNSFLEPELRMRNYDFTYDEPYARCCLYCEYVTWIERPSSGTLCGNLYLFDSVDYFEYFDLDVSESVMPNLTVDVFSGFVGKYMFHFPGIVQLAYAEIEGELVGDPTGFLVYLHRFAEYWNNIESPKLVDNIAPTDLLKNIRMFSGRLSDLSECHVQVAKHDGVYAIRFMGNPFFPFWVEIPAQYALEVAKIIWK